MLPTASVPARTARRGLLVLAGVAATGCATWHRAPTAPGAASRQMDHVRVTRPDGRRFELWQARVVNDTLYGYAAPRWGRAVPRTVVVPADSVRLLELRGVRGGRTVGLAATVIGIGLGAVVLIVALAGAYVSSL